MASPLVQKFRNDTAPRLLARFANGGVAVKVRITTPSPSPLHPPIVTESTREINAYAKGVTAEMQAQDPNLQVGDLAVIVAAVDYSPAVGDVLNINDRDWRVIRVSAIPANGPAAAFWAWVR